VARYAGIIGILSFCLGVLAFSPTVGASASGHRSPVQAAASPSVTPTLPDPQTLMSQAASHSRSRHSVLVSGTVRSSNDRVYDGSTFWANFSWRKHLFHNLEHYRRPTTLGAFTKVRTIRRVAIGAWLAVHVHRHWYCTKTTQRQNAGYWQPPTFTLTSLKTLGKGKVGPYPVWLVAGSFKEHSRSSTLRASVTVDIDQADYLFRAAVAKGTVRTKHVGQATLHQSVHYSSYGRPVTVKLPAACSS